MSVESEVIQGATFALCAAVTACGARTGLASAHGDAGIELVAVDATTMDSLADSPAPGPPLNGIVLNECGPADGHALAFIVGPNRLECSAGCSRDTCPPDPTPPTRDVISLYENLPTGPTTISFAVSGPNGVGDAISCRANACNPATDVELVLTKFAPSGGDAAGSYRLRFSDGSAVSATFVVTVCQNRTFCG